MKGMKVHEGMNPNVFLVNKFHLFQIFKTVSLTEGTWKTVAKMVSLLPFSKFTAAKKQSNHHAS